jgi:hypothetical protein
VFALAFPDALDPPAECPERRGLPLVSRSVVRNLLVPEPSIRFRAYGSVPATVPVPKTPIDEDYRTEAGQHDIGRSGEVTYMKSKSQACAMQEPTNDQLGGGILATDPLHQRRALRSGLHRIKERKKYMWGPSILARSMSVATKRGKDAESWQYHSRSDSHSKIACWTVLFDLLCECDVLRRHAELCRIGFGINHVMVGPINKTLDLVLTVVPPSRPRGKRPGFAELSQRYAIPLSSDEQAMLESLPIVEEDSSKDISEVAIALEAKACMTEHLKSIPRLHAEILATGYLAKKAAPRCITVSYSMVNAAESFISPGGKGKINRHNQPEDARRVVSMLGTALPLTRDTKDFGFDVVGTTVVDCRNDGSPVTVVSEFPAPSTADHHHYERMIRSICSEYRSRFAMQA